MEKQEAHYNLTAKRIRNIRATAELNQYLDFPHVEQAFKVERITKNMKKGRTTHVIACGITSKKSDRETAEPVLQDTVCIGEERTVVTLSLIGITMKSSRISKGYGPENMTRLRRFAVELLKIE